MKFKKTIISLFIMSAIVVGLIFPVAVSAAEVESLPAFSNDITVSYDDAGVIFKTAEHELYMSFSQSLKVGDSYIKEYNTDGTVSTINQPLKHPEYVDSGQYSYWYSASEARIYVMAALGNRFNIVSYNDGCFLLNNDPDAYYMALSYYDLDTGSFNPVAMISGTDILYKMYYAYVDLDGLNKDMPDDLLCIFSNYVISGFFESEASDVYTPDYYFKYQYLFHVDGVGYTFVDAARPLVSISNDDPTKAILMFDGMCNKHIYTSVNGSTWNCLTSAISMYSASTLLDYNYFYDSPGGDPVYTLVYTNDIDYDDPLILPEYGDMEDISDVLSKFDLSEVFEQVDLFELPLNTIAPPLLYFYGEDYDGWYDSLYNSDHVYNWEDFILLQSLASEFSSDYSVTYEELDTGIYAIYKQTSLRSYIKSMYNSINDLVLYARVLQSGLHADLQSVFDNISITNTYLYDIKKLIKDLPDYTKDIRELKAAIDAIDIQSPDVVIPDINIPDYTQVLEDIRVLLENLDVNVGVPSDGNVTLEVPEFDDTEILNSLSGIYSSVNYIAGLMEVDDVTDFFVHLFEEEQSEDAEDVGEFITNAINIINASKLLTAAFDYMGTLSNGITWVNLNVQHIYDVSGALRGVLLLGVTLFCVNLIVRRDG